MRIGNNHSCALVIIIHARTVLWLSRETVHGRYKICRNRYRMCGAHSCIKVLLFLSHVSVNDYWIFRSLIHNNLPLDEGGFFFGRQEFPIFLSIPVVAVGTSSEDKHFSERTATLGWRAYFTEDDYAGRLVNYTSQELILFNTTVLIMITRWKKCSVTNAVVLKTIVEKKRWDNVKNQILLCFFFLNCT